MKLDLTERERLQLRRASIRLRDLPRANPVIVASASGIPFRRCLQLVALSSFQTLGSVGPESAKDLWSLGFRSLEDLRAGDPRQMYEKLKGRAGALDPCVEDVFRCAVAQTLHPDLPAHLRNWWSWKELRGKPAGALPGAPIDSA